MEKKRETTTLSVHRCRFVDYAPSAITALAFPPLPLPSTKGKKKTTSGKQPLKFGMLAVGHANGNIDLCQWMDNEHELESSQAWVVQKVLPGPYPSKVDSLAFVIRYPDDFDADDVPTCSDLRLFSFGGGSELLEWDLQRSCIRRTISSHGGSIWCIAANPACTSLALGCEDGTVRLLSIANDTLMHSRRFDRVKCRMLSIAWGPPVPRQQQSKTKTQKAESSDESSDDDDEDEWNDSWLVTGGSDSSLRKWDVATGRVVERMGMDKMRGERTLVWAVGVLGDGTIVSGDSLGIVKFWDSRTCTQLQTFQAHGADVLCLTISPEGKAVYTSGVDQKTIQFSLIKTSNSPSSRWAQTASRRMHSHDVRALTSWPPYTPLPPSFKRTFPIDIAPILASGGLDMSVVVAPAALPTSTIVKVTNPLHTSTEATFEDAYHRRLAYSTAGIVKVARSARLVSCVREAGVSVWRIKSRPPTMELGDDEEPDIPEASPEEPYSGGWDKVLEMDLNVNTNIVASEISDDGRWLVVSDMYEAKLFALRTDAKDQLNLKRVKDFPSIIQFALPPSSPSTGGLAFAFTPDSSKLVMSTIMTSYILVIDLSREMPRVLRRFEHHRARDSIVHDRVVKGLKTGGANPDVEMADAGAEEEAEKEEVDDEDDEDDEEEVDTSPLLVNIHKLAISPDGQWLASSDERCRTHIFNLDSISHHTVLPSFSRPVQCLAFDSSHPNTLLLAFPNNTIQVYDVEARQFPTWGKDLSSSLPKRFTYAHDPVLGVTFDPSLFHSTTGERQPGYALFWGASWIFKVSFETSPRLAGTKRRRDAAPIAPEEERPWRDYKMVTHYRPLLCVDFLDKGEIVVVERPLVDVLSTLPPAYFKHKYGAS